MSDLACLVLGVLVSTTVADRRDAWQERAQHGELLAVVAEMDSESALEPGEEELLLDLLQQLGDFEAALDRLRAAPESIRERPDRVRREGHLLWALGDYGAARRRLQTLAQGTSPLAAAAAADVNRLRELEHSLEPLQQAHRRLAILRVVGWIGLVVLGAIAFFRRKGG